MLSRHRASPLVCCALLDLASGGRTSPQGGAYAADGSRQLLHPSALMLLLEVLAGCGRLAQQQQLLAELEALVEARMANAEALLDSEWLQWSASRALTQALLLA